MSQKSNKSSDNAGNQKHQDLIAENKIYGSDLLNRPHPEGYREEWIESLKLSATEDVVELRSLLVFRIRNEWFSLPISCIVEVTKASFIHSLPHTNSKVILGITNVQGELLIAISMKTLLGLPATPFSQPESYIYSKYTRNIVFGIKKNIFVFPVDEIYGLTHVKSDKIEPVPISVSKSLKNFFSGMFVLPDNKIPVGLLDEKLIINSLNENYL